MKQRRWTLLIVPQGSGASRSVEVSLGALKAVGTAIGVVVIAAAITTWVAISKAVDISHLERLERTNQLLAQELDRTEGAVLALSDTINSITRLDREVRLIAGLDVIDPAVLQAGVGGPITALAPDDAVLVENADGRRALDVRATLDGLMRRANILSRSFRQAVDTLNHHIDRMERTPSLSPIPLDVGTLTSGFAESRIHPIHGDARPHEAVDIAAEMNTPIIAPAAGIVVDVGTRAGYGRLVVLDHGNGLVTKYAHASRTLVRVGQRVKRGDTIALVGRTGIATAPHLHYEVVVNGRHVDPRTYILPEDRIVD